jgi:uncharacterized lipoprotein YddW (UPF0748 family)
MLNQINLCLFIILLTASVPGTAQNPPKREMRAVWIATVENIDWPSSSLLSSEAQKKELTGLLDIIKGYNLNTVILQIRPSADAFYESDLEPWSQWLTGTQGKAPEPFYDPLEFVIMECRLRGLDVHVWLNPYRAVRDTSFHKTAPGHVSNIHPDWVITYGATKYLDPALPQVRDHVAHVVSDIVRRYDIDAVHMDDYFYPYRIAGLEFPDDSSFSVFHGEYAADHRDDWRRNNVDRVIKQIHDSIKAIKPYVEFGISPFGVWRNADVDSSGSATTAGQTNYDDLFANVLKWQKEGWIDYVAPQLYWQIGMQAADYKILAEWWNRNTYGCQLYIGHGIYRLDPESNTEAWRSSDEIIKQIKLNRNLENIAGSIFYSAKFLRSNPLELRQNLMQEFYRYPAIPLVNSRVAGIIPGSPLHVAMNRKLFKIKLSWGKNSNTKTFIIYRFSKGETHDFTDPANIFRVNSSTSLQFRSNRSTRLTLYNYAITALSPTNIESGGIYFKR